MAMTRTITSGLIAIAIGLLMIAGAVQAVRGEVPLAETVPPGRIVIIDGDTVELPCIAPACTGVERIRIYNIDAPEIGGARCAAEREMGLEAKAALAALLHGQPVTIHRCEPAEHPTYPPRCRDRFGRTLARLATPAGDVGEAMIARGKALPWAPGRAAHDARAAIFCGR